MKVLLFALAGTAGAKQFREAKPVVDWMSEPTSPCMKNELGKAAWPCFIEGNSRQMVRDYVAENSTVLEIGARYGSVSCVIAAKQKESGKVVSVESDERVWAALDSNIAEYGCNVKVVKGVIGTTPVTINTAVGGNGGYGTRTVPAADAAGHPVKEAPGTHIIPNFPLADIEKKFNLKFDTLIADCEGCFPTLIKENPDLLKQVSTLIVEAHSDQKTDTEEAAVHDLARHGFKVIKTISRQRVLVKVPPPTPEELAAKKAAEELRAEAALKLKKQNEAAIEKHNKEKEALAFKG